MRLTTDMRRAFIEAVMRDVPQKDFVTEARKLIQDAYLAKLPKPIRAIYDNTELRGFLATSHPVSMPKGIYGSMYGGDMAPYRELPAALRSKVEKLVSKHEQQDKARRELRQRLRAAADACNTRKQLTDRFPEFEKWVPGSPSVVTPNLPADTSIVADLVKLGWPSGKDLRAALTTT